MRNDHQFAAMLVGWAEQANCDYYCY